jgi:hypothetical protein
MGMLRWFRRLLRTVFFVAVVLLAMFLAGAAYYFFCIKTNPELSRKSMQQVEEGWNKTKSSGDQMIEKIRPYATGENANTNSNEENQ